MVRFALPDLPHHRVHIGEVPDLGELAVFDAIKSELRNSHWTTGRLEPLDGYLRCRSYQGPWAREHS